MFLSFYLRCIDVAELSVIAAFATVFSGDLPASDICLPEEVYLINLLRTEGLGLLADDHDY